MTYRTMPITQDIPAALDGYECEDCGTLFLASEVRSEQVETRDGLVTKYRCAKPRCQKLHLDPCCICPICEVRKSAPGYDECAPCAKVIDDKGVDAALKNLREQRHAELKVVLFDIARTIA